MKVAPKNSVKTAETGGNTAGQFALLQRKCECGGTAGISGDCEECQNHRLQRQVSDSAKPLEAPSLAHDVPRLPGQTLDAATRTSFEPRLGHDFSRVGVHGRTAQAIQPKLFIGQPGDSFELEADRVASEVMHMPDAFTLEPRNIKHTHGELTARSVALPGAIEQTGEQTKGVTEQTPALQPEVAESIHAMLGGGQPFPAAGRSFFEPRFGYTFSQVKIHTGSRAADLANSVNAQAFTVGRDIFFSAGQYNPSSTSGRRLLAHELTHVVQQAGGKGFVGTSLPERSSARNNGSHPNITTTQSGSQPVSPSYRPNISRLGPPHIMRQPQPQTTPPQTTPQSGSPPAAASGPLLFLREMLSYVQTLEQFVQTILQTGSLPTPATPVPARRGGRRSRTPPQPPQSPQQRAHRALNQRNLQQLIRSANLSYERENNLLPANDPMRTSLRELYVQVLDELRRLSMVSLDISNQLDPAVRDAEQVQYAETLAQLIEVSPMTSAGLTGTTTFQQADVTAGTNYEAALERYLDDLLTRLPTLTLTPVQKDQIFERIQVALRRAFLTVGTGPSGTIDLRAITNPQILDKYRRVSALLAGGISTPRQMSIITDAIPPYQLPDPVPNVSSQITGRTVDLSHVPADEVDSVRYAVWFAVRTIFPATSTIRLQNASWPVALQIRRGANIVSIRYDLVFDNVGNVRAERLGEARAREVAPAFAQLSIPDKKTQLIADFGLVAVDDRPPAPAIPATATTPLVPARLVASWTAPELDQVKAAFDMIPAADRTSLNGFTLVRDHQGPAQGAGRTLLGLHHTGASAAHDDPVPPPHGPPHIHYYDDAFTHNTQTAVGAPGATGPGADQTLLHEVGHARIARASRAANAATTAANGQLTLALAQLGSVSFTTAQAPALNAWSSAQLTANTAIVAFNNSLITQPPATPAQQAPLLQAAQAAVTARDAVRPGLAAAGFSAAVVRNAANLDAANDALLAAAQQSAAAQDQVPVFVSLATRFGFHRFTDYARTDPNDEEWFAETYALHLTDPNRLNQMNRSIFLWFQAGMPMDRSFTP